ASADISSLVGTFRRQDERCFRGDMHESCAEHQERREAPLGHQYMSETQVARDAVRVFAQELSDRELHGQLRVQRARGLGGNLCGAAVLAREDDHLESVRREAGAVAEIELERRAIRKNRPQHVALRGPTLHTALGTDLEPIGATVENFDALVPVRDIEYRK